MQKVTTAVIAVAGWGSRFLPASKAVPKELFPIVDKPVIEYIVEDCLRSGITEIVFVNSAHKTALEKHFSPNSELNTALEKKGKEELLQAVGRFEGKIDFKYVYQEEALGTAHAILQAKDYIQDKPFVILYGDDFIIGKKPMVRQLLDVYEEKQKSVIGLVEFPESELHKYGIAALDDQNRFQHFVEKPAPGTAPSKYGWIGVSVATPALVPLLETLELSPRGEYEITDAWTQLAAQEDVYTQPFEWKRFDTGDKQGFILANVEMGIQRFGKEFKDTLASLSAGVVQKERRVYPKQGEVYFADLGPIISTEQAKRRPVIILSNVSFKRRNTVLVAPLSSNVSSMDKKVHCIISKLERGSLSSGSSKVLLDHVRTIDKDRLIRCEGVITENDLSVIQKKIQECIL